MKLKLTASQIPLWVGQKLNPDIPLYNTAYSYDISGSINEVVFKKAFKLLIETTDVFRIQFMEEGGIPYQFAQPRIEYELQIIDFSDTPHDAAISEWLEVRASQKLDLSKLVFDAALLKITKKRYIWFLNIHHLVTDAVSRKIVFNRMSGLYADLLENKVDRVKLEGPSYLDYVKSELELANTPSDKNNFWFSKILDQEKVSQFYGEKPKEKSTEATRIQIGLGLERTRKLKSFAQHPDVRGWTQNLTLFNIIASLLFIYLYRISGQKQIIIGSPLHNRISRQYYNTAGYFLEIFPLVIQFTENDTFNAVLQRVMLETKANLKHALQDTITEEISSSFNVVLNFIHTNFYDFNGYKTISNWLYTGNIDRSHSMRCHVMEMNKNEEIKLLFDLNNGTFNPQLRQKVPLHFLNLLDAMLDDMNLQIEKPGLLSLQEIEDMIRKPRAVASRESLNLLLQHITDKSPKSIALKFDGQTLTYEELDQEINYLAYRLLTCGLKSGHRIGLYLYRSPEYIIALLAVLKLGAVFVPISSDQPPERLKYLLQDSGCTMVLTNSGLINNIPGIDIEILHYNLGDQKSLEIHSGKLNGEIKETSLAYIMYTSGSTGYPKGVMISRKSLANYLLWARDYYQNNSPFIFPLFTSIGFDLTMTSVFLPLLSAGHVAIYKEKGKGPDIALLDIIEDNLVNSIKLTPSHLSLLQGTDLSNSKIKTMILGGEDLKTHLVKLIQTAVGDDLKIYNEYGPTEATIGCIVAHYNNLEHQKSSVPIGKLIINMDAYILDSHKNPVPKGVIGHLYLSGDGLSEGYLNLPEQTQKKFIDNPFVPGSKMYFTGDLSRINEDDDFEYLGRIDEQIKLRGFRIELEDIEANMLQHNMVENAAVILLEDEKGMPDNEVVNCMKCGLPSNYPNTDFDKNGVCHICTAFEGYKDQAKRYFKTEEALKDILTSNHNKSQKYDCISLLSGGKDSTYVLARLVKMGLRVLAFTLDNGYISEQAKANIDKIVKRLNVDHVYGETPHMNKIFVDSLHRHSNVCNGCFKTIYTLATKHAVDHKIPFIVTGLSRGQFFETRLTEELFWNEAVDTKSIDETILAARKLYHQEEDAVSQYLEVDMFKDESTFEKVQFVDFYRYSDVKVAEMLSYLKEKIGWLRPTDTGRSTNCRINQLGIYVHKKVKGYSNYSFPYSWDVRMGHKTRQETLEEINEYIDEKEVKKIMGEIGYSETGDSGNNEKRIVAYYTGPGKISYPELNSHLSEKLPPYMLPSVYRHLDEMPLSANGKIDKKALKQLSNIQVEMDIPFVSARNDIEMLLERIWGEVLQLNKVGVHDNFILLGGHSLAAIRITARLNQELGLKFPLNKIFELPTIAQYGSFIENSIKEILEKEQS